VLCTISNHYFIFIIKMSAQELTVIYANIKLCLHKTSCFGLHWKCSVNYIKTKQKCVQKIKTKLKLTPLIKLNLN